MARWLQSGLRRDVCALVADRGDPTGQALKRPLEEHYGEAVRPKTFYGALDALVKAGHLRAEPDGLHDRYELTDAGERRLRDHADWLAVRVEDGGEGDEGDEREG